MNKESGTVNFATVLLYVSSVFLIVEGDFWIGMGFFVTASTIMSALMYNKRKESFPDFMPGNDQKCSRYT